MPSVFINLTTCLDSGVGDYNDIALQLQDRTLVLIGKHPKNRFTHVFQIPSHSNPNKAKATQGILTVKIPRMKNNIPLLYSKYY